jgi:hypothetical protein
LQHRYIVWQGHFRGRYYSEMHIVDHEEKTICHAWRPASVEHETVYRGRPDGYPLCRNCTRHREEFEQREKLRTWKALAEASK